MYPVLISTTASGITLKERLEKPLNLDSPHQWARWTWMLLCSILTRPGDGRTSNYILDPQDNIFCIDNDISFVEPFVQKIVSQIHFCSALFCLFQDRPLDRGVLEEFCSLDVDAILLDWIEDVIRKEAEYLSLFSEEERSRLFEEDPNNRFKATILFREGVLATLNMQFVYLQNQIRSLLHRNKQPTPIELLKSIVALSDSNNVNLSPGTYISKTYSKAKQPSIEQKLRWITSRSQDQSLSSLKSDEACLGRVPTAEEIEWKEAFFSCKGKRRTSPLSFTSKRRLFISWNCAWKRNSPREF